jgi:SAM-dependent methyltransferase
MEAQRFTSAEARRFWQTLYSSGGSADCLSEGDVLGLVCSPGAPALYNRYCGYFQERVFRRAQDQCAQVAGGRVLELGSGTGRWTRLLVDRDAEVVGVEIADEAVKIAERRSQKHISCVPICWTRS